MIKSCVIIKERLISRVTYLKARKGLLGDKLKYVLPLDYGEKNTQKYFFIFIHHDNTEHCILQSKQS